MVDDDPEIESSPLSGSVAEDGITVRVEYTGWSVKTNVGYSK